MNVLDLFIPGETQDFGTHTFTAEEIIAFAKLYDPQPFHLDAEAAKASLFGGLCASGWHTTAMWMRKNCDHRPVYEARLRAEGRPVPAYGPSPGFKNLKWLRPVFAGETIRFGLMVKGARALGSRPGWGLVQSEGHAFHGETCVMRFDSTVLIRL